jgi:hypothetical protein
MNTTQAASDLMDYALMRDRAIAAEAERDEARRQLSDVQMQLNRLANDFEIQTTRLVSAERGFALLVADYNAAMTKLAKYEKVTA